MVWLTYLPLCKYVCLSFTWNKTNKKQLAISSPFPLLHSLRPNPLILTILTVYQIPHYLHLSIPRAAWILQKEKKFDTICFCAAFFPNCMYPIVCEYSVHCTGPLLGIFCGGLPPLHRLRIFVPIWALSIQFQRLLDMWRAKEQHRVVTRWSACVHLLPWHYFV